MSTPINVDVELTIPTDAADVPSVARVVGAWNAYASQHDAPQVEYTGYGHIIPRADFHERHVADGPKFTVSFKANGFEIEGLRAAARRFTSRFPDARVSYTVTSRDDNDQQSEVVTGGALVKARPSYPTTTLSTTDIILAAIAEYEALTDEDVDWFVADLAARIDSGSYTARVAA